MFEHARQGRPRIHAAAALVLACGPAWADAPERLSDTGLYVPGTTEVRAQHVAFAPQYPLWSDGAVKTRWLSLPSGAAIDARDPDAWEFPAGTRLWKQFGYDRPVETRYIERLADGSWRFAAYVWDADGRDARLAPAQGVTVAANGAPNGRYTVPSVADCLACHEGAAVPVLGVSALQLSPDRDPLAPHAEPGAGHADLRELAARSLLRNLPAAVLDSPPRIDAPSPAARAALGYLHGNCGHCHNAAGPLAPLDLVLAQSATDRASWRETVRSLAGQSSRFRSHGTNSAQRVVAGRPDLSVLAGRMRSRNPLEQMPPVGTVLIDRRGLALVERWIQELSLPTE